MGAVSMYFYKKISDLETIVKDLQQQVVVQNGQLNELKNYLSSSPQKTLLRIPTQREVVSPPQGYSLPAQSREPDPGVGRSLSEGQRVAGLSSDDRRPRSDREMTKSLEAHLSPRRIGSRIPESGIEDELVDCSDGVCKLVSGGKKVVISKISKQADFDRESFQVNHPLKVETFKRTSPNPIIKSVTPKPSESISEAVEQILNEIDNELRAPDRRAPNIAEHPDLTF